MGEHNIQNTRSMLSPGHRGVSTTVRHLMTKTPTLVSLGRCRGGGGKRRMETSSWLKGDQC